MTRTCIDTSRCGAHSQRSARESKGGESLSWGTDIKRQAGKRLKTYILDRMSVRDIHTLVELAEQADVAYDTLHAWFRGRAPTPRAGGRVANTLRVTYSELLAAYEGSEPTGGRYVRDEDLEALVEAAAEAAVRRVLGDRDEPGRP